MPKHATRFISSALASALLLSACSSLEPKPSTDEENRQRILADQARMYSGQEPVIAPITL
jgi:PBP1b-binding outer membrane lipoprotein LpoB